MSSKMNTQKSVLLLKDGATLPTTEFIELQEPLIVNPNPTVEEFKRVSGKLGATDSYADVDRVIFNETVSHKMRHQNGAADALNTAPEYTELLKISGFSFDVTAETLILSDITGISKGDTITGDTSGASGTVSYIDTVANSILVTGVTGAPFAVGGEQLNTATYTATSAGYSPTFINTQTPSRGSAKIYIDGKKFELTDTLVADTTMTFEVGKAGIISSAMSGFIDNNGIPTNEANPSVTLNSEACMIVSNADIMLAGGTSLEADSISITMNPDIVEFYGIGALKEFCLQDYAIKVTADFYVDSPNYADAMTKLVNQTVEAIDIKMGTVSTGALVNGKSVHLVADLAKASTVSDSEENQSVKRSFTWILQLDSQDTALAMIHGKHV